MMLDKEFWVTKITDGLNEKRLVIEEHEKILRFVEDCFEEVINTIEKWCDDKKEKLKKNWSGYDFSESDLYFDIKISDILKKLNNIAEKEGLNKSDLLHHILFNAVSDVIDSYCEKNFKKEGL